ncbi:MAG TPA: outer membrane beta-barrel protein [Chitinophagales bacterium]|nr:outer membrane beta-barrel protein [Chitinophagales bacterium]
MKTKIISLIVFMFICIFGFAQTKNVGFYAGPNFANINITSPDLNAQNHSGYQVGGFYRKGKTVYGQVGLEYLKLQTNLINDTVSGAIDLNRFQLPLYGGINLLNPAKKILNVRLYAGPVVTFTSTAPSFNPEFTLKDFTRFGINGTAGAGLDVLFFTLDAGYTFGLNNLFSNTFDGKADYAFVNLGLKF